MTNTPRRFSCRIATHAATDIAAPNAVFVTTGNQKPSANFGGAIAGTEITVLLRADIGERGHISVAGEASCPTIGFIDTDTKANMGLDANRAPAVGEKLGKEFRKQNSTFDATISSIRGADFDAGMSWTNHTEIRCEVVDVSRCGEYGSSMFGLACLEKGSESVDAPCGASGAAQKSTARQTDKATTSDTWKVAQTASKFALSGEPYVMMMHGVADAKGSPLAEPISGTVAAITANGTYAQIL